MELAVALQPLCQDQLDRNFLRRSYYHKDKGIANSLLDYRFARQSHKDYLTSRSANLKLTANDHRMPEDQGNVDSFRQ